MQKTTLLALLLAGAGSAAAQSTERLRRPVALAPELQIAAPLADNNYVYFSLGGRRQTESFAGRNPALGLDYLNLTAGYEHAWNPRWSWGVTLRYAKEPATGFDRSAVVPGLLLRHRAALGPVQFGQRLGVEYALGAPAYNAAPFYTTSVYSRTLLRLRLDVEKLIRLGSQPGGLALRPRVSFEPALFLRLQKADLDADKRTVDFTSLRGEVGVQAGPQLSITPWAGVQANYSRTLIQTDKNGAPTSNGKLNTTTPMVGLDLRYTFPTPFATANWQQLPTQN
ncbi:hypothetical protein [Hymenobacter psoromatis]|uniref:hypothetical protein n=1 Tax=Hymenobacter psoromatis TaxID=1484116 RepID=UPI001CBC085C|nr:hypothetical protein [Hymenobacter psoromatis]